MQTGDQSGKKDPFFAFVFCSVYQIFFYFKIYFFEV